MFQKLKPKRLLVKELNEPRPLPMGRQAFEEWSDRIIKGALIPGATIATQKWTLANLIMHLGPTESHKPDAFFIHSLRKLAANQVADAIRVEIREEEKAKIAAQEAKLKSEQIASLPTNEQILENKSV